MQKAAKPDLVLMVCRALCLRGARPDESPAGAVDRRYSTAMASLSGVIVGKQSRGVLAPHFLASIDITG